MASDKGTFIGYTRDHYPVYDRTNSHIPTESGLSREIIKEALGYMYANGARFKQKEIRFHRNIGYNQCVKINQGDEVIMVYRKGRAGKTPMVKNRTPEPCNVLTIIIKKDQHLQNSYILITCFIGKGGFREPWDKNIRSPEERKQCEEYWRTHALIYNPDQIDCERM